MNKTKTTPPHPTHQHALVIGNGLFYLAHMSDKTYHLRSETKTMTFSYLGAAGRAIRLLHLAHKKSSTLDVIKRVKAATKKVTVVTPPASITPPTPTKTKTESIPTEACREVAGTKITLKNAHWKGDTLHWLGLDNEPCKLLKGAIMRDVSRRILVITGTCPEWAKLEAASDQRKPTDPFEAAMEKARAQKARVFVNDKELTLITWKKGYLTYSNPVTNQGDRMPYVSLKASIASKTAHIENTEHLSPEVAEALGIRQKKAA